MDALLYLGIGAVAVLASLVVVLSDPTVLEQYGPEPTAPPLLGPPPLDEDEAENDDAYDPFENWGV